MRKQGDNKPVENFITDLYILVEHCGCNALHDEMIRDRIIVGIHDRSVSEKMQMDLLSHSRKEYHLLNEASQ